MKNEAASSPLRIDMIPMEEIIFPEPYRSYIEIMGLNTFQQMIERFGGKSIYVPKEGAIERIILEHTIKREYNGSNITKLSRKYNIPRSSIYGYLKR